MYNECSSVDKTPDNCSINYPILFPPHALKIDDIDPHRTVIRGLRRLSMYCGLGKLIAPKKIVHTIFPSMINEVSAGLGSHLAAEQRSF